MVVVEHHAAAHHHHPGRIGLGNELSQRFLPRRALAAGVQVEVQAAAKPVGNLFDRLIRSGGAGKVRRRLAIGQRVLAVPALALLAQEQRLQQVGRWAGEGLVAPGPEVRNRQGLDRGLRQEEVPDGGRRRPRVGLQLLERGLQPLRFPIGQLRKAFDQRAVVQPGAIAGPTQQLRLDVYARHYKS